MNDSSSIFSSTVCIYFLSKHLSVSHEINVCIGTTVRSLKYTIKQKKNCKNFIRLTIEIIVKIRTFSTSISSIIDKAEQNEKKIAQICIDVFINRKI